MCSNAKRLSKMTNLVRPPCKTKLLLWNLLAAFGVSMLKASDISERKEATLFLSHGNII